MKLTSLLKILDLNLEVEILENSDMDYGINFRDANEALEMIKNGDLFKFTSSKVEQITIAYNTFYKNRHFKIILK